MLTILSHTHECLSFRLCASNPRRCPLTSSAFIENPSYIVYVSYVSYWALRLRRRRAMPSVIFNIPVLGRYDFLTLIFFGIFFLDVGAGLPIREPFRPPYFLFLKFCNYGLVFGIAELKLFAVVLFRAPHTDLAPASGRSR